MTQKRKSRGVFSDRCRNRAGQTYFGLNVSNMIQVVLEADRNPASVRVETENVPAEAVSVRVRRGELVLACDPRSLVFVVQEKERYVQAGCSVCGRRPLESFSSGMSSVFSETEIDKPSVTVECMGMSEFESNIRCRSLTMSVSGMSIYKRAGGMRGYSDGGGIRNEPGRRGFYVPGFGLYADRYVRL